MVLHIFLCSFCLKLHVFLCTMKNHKDMAKIKVYGKAQNLPSGGKQLRLFQLARGSAIKVLYPQWLADAVKQQHQEAVNLYE